MPLKGRKQYEVECGFEAKKALDEALAAGDLAQLGEVCRRYFHTKAGYEATLLDPDGNPTPTGSEGNLWVKGASTAIGYWERPETTAATFVDGWVRTGDLYRCDRDGFWFHMGRSDDWFKSSGQWVSPVEVEGVLMRHRGVSRAAVVEDFDAEGLPCACAFVIGPEGLVDEPALEI